MTTKKSTNTLPENQIPAVKTADDDSRAVEKELEIKIQDLTAQLSGARGKLNELRGETVGNTKSARAIEYYKNNPGMARKEYIAHFITELNFGKAYAGTMYGTIRKKEKAGNL